jgi:predicted RNA binding protein YcfA (HicA-like mRNA interferase family)
MPRFTPEHWRTLEAVFLAAGFRFVRQEGSHRSYVKAGATRPVVIPSLSQRKPRMNLVLLADGTFPSRRSAA